MKTHTLVKFKPKPPEPSAVESTAPSVKGFNQSRLSSDRKGHSTQLSFRVRPEEARAIEELTKEFYAEGYRSRSDLIRHAVRDHCERLSAQKTNPKIESLLTKLHAHLEQMEHELHVQDWDEFMETLEKQIERAERAGAHAEARKIALRAKAHVKSLGEGFWQDYYMGEITRRLGRLL